MAEVCIIPALVVVAMISYIAGCGKGHDAGYADGTASIWRTLKTLPIGEPMYCCGSFLKKEGQLMCPVVDAEQVNYWFVRTEKELPRKFILLLEKGNVRVMEVP